MNRRFVAPGTCGGRTALTLESVRAAGRRRSRRPHRLRCPSAPFRPAVEAGDILFLAGQIGAVPKGVDPQGEGFEAACAMRWTVSARSSPRATSVSAMS